MRTVQARRAVLACVYEAKTKGRNRASLDGMAKCAHGDFLGSRLTRAEIQGAYTYLVQKRLLKGHVENASGWPTAVEITDLGEDCMTEHQGDVAAFLGARTAAQTVTNIGSIYGGTNAIGNAYAVQNVHNGIDSAALREIIAQLTAALTQFGDAEPEIRPALQELEEEAAASQPNPSRVWRALGHILDVAKQVGAAMVILYLEHQAQKWGIAPPSGSAGVANS